MNKDPLRIAHSKADIPIRITAERWTHVTENHDYMAGEMDKVIESIENLDVIVSGNRDEKIALKHYEKTSITEKHTVIVYKEQKSQGFLITAFMTSKPEKITSKGILWEKSDD
jgi:hypothetical protein